MSGPTEALGRGILAREYAKAHKNPRGGSDANTACCYFGGGWDPELGEGVCQACHDKLVSFWDWLERVAGRR